MSGTGFGRMSSEATEPDWSLMVLCATLRGIQTSALGLPYAWMLQERPGCYIRVGNGEGEDGGCVVHNPNYDFNDEAALYGASYWAALVEQELSPV